MKTRYRIYDTFNRRVVSSHKSLRTAVIAADKFGRDVRRYNGENAYIPVRIEYLAEADVWIGVPTDDVHDAQQQFLNR